jgi:hypothetical protein
MYMSARKELMKRHVDESTGLINEANVKRSLEEAEIMQTGMKLVLMNPAINSRLKREYETAFSKLNDEIKELKIMMDCLQKGMHSL